jgi:hypothetical protein
MEAKLFSHNEKGGFHSKEDLRSWLNKGLRGDGKYLLARGGIIKKCGNS